MFCACGTARPGIGAHTVIKQPGPAGTVMKEAWAFVACLMQLLPAPADALPGKYKVLAPKLCAVQVAERGLQFVHTFAQLLAEQQGPAGLPSLFREAWAFSACISLATTTCRLMAGPPATTKLADQPPSPISQQYR